jgi:hypothetical protein
MKWFTSDLHFAHPFVAALRGYALPGYAKDASIKQQAEHEHKPLKNCVDWRKHDADIIVFDLRRPRPLGRGGSKPSSFHRLI